MTKKTISDAIDHINAEYIDKAAGYTVPKKKRASVWLAWVACMCLVLAGFFAVRHEDGNVANTVPTVTDLMRDNVATTVGTLAPDESAGSKERIPVYTIVPLNYSVSAMQKALTAAGWASMTCTLSDEYTFVFKGNANGKVTAMTAEENRKQATAFLKDSGLEALLVENKIEYTFTFSNGGDLAVTNCYLLFDGEKTGAYIRFIFDDDHCIGEVQGYLYNGSRLDSLKALSWDEVLKRAYRVNSEGVLEEINADDYTIKNENLVYINGLPYYRFNGYGKNTRSAIEGYALAVDIESSVFAEQLMAAHRAFKIK